MVAMVMFEIHASDPERAARFYGEAFDWQFDNPANDFYRLTNDSPVQGSIFRRRGPDPVDGQPLNAWACTLQVESVDAALSAVQRAGGRSAVPKFALPGVGWSAYFKDTEGNIVGLFETYAGAR